MLKDEKTINLISYLDTCLKNKFKAVFLRKFPIYWRYTIGETMLAVIWFKKGTVELGALDVKNPSEWDSYLEGSKYVGLRYTKFINSAEQGKKSVNDIVLQDDSQK